jgi:predicted transcriptional regulator
MGGRKPTSIRKVLGNLRQSVHERRDLGRALSDENPSQIAESTTNTIRKSTNVIRSLSNAIQMLGVFSEKEKEDLGTTEARKIATQYWENVKQERKIEPNLETDRILINLVSRLLKRGGKK